LEVAQGIPLVEKKYSDNLKTAVLGGLTILGVALWLHGPDESANVAYRKGHLRTAIHQSIEDYRRRESRRQLVRLACGFRLSSSRALDLVRENEEDIPGPATYLTWFCVFYFRSITKLISVIVGPLRFLEIEFYREHLKHR